MSGDVPTPIVGCDVVDVARMRLLLTERSGARDRIFTPGELADSVRGGVAEDGDVAVERLAARFAAKEAARKALAGRGPSLTAIEVRTDAAGAPSVWIGGVRTRLACSLSHDAGIALAVVVGDSSMLDELTRSEETSERSGTLQNEPR
jgi:phosphopantetheine--protein transferase-like protein